MGEEPGAFRVRAYGEVRAQGRDGTLVGAPLILKDEVSTPFRQPRVQLIPRKHRETLRPQVKTR